MCRSRKFCRGGGGGGGGGGGFRSYCHKKALTMFLFYLVLSLFYRSPMVISFSKVPEGVTFSWE